MLNFYIPSLDYFKWNFFETVAAVMIFDDDSNDSTSSFSSVKRSFDYNI